MVVIKKHWLYGDIKFNIDVQEEDKCSECIHWQVCKRDMSEFCLNYCFGTSDSKASCKGCFHRHTRYCNDEDKLPCFRCKHFTTKRWSVS